MTFHILRKHVNSVNVLINVWTCLYIFSVCHWNVKIKSMTKRRRTAVLFRVFLISESYKFGLLCSSDSRMWLQINMLTLGAQLFSIDVNPFVAWSCSNLLKNESLHKILEDVTLGYHKERKSCSEVMQTINMQSLRLRQNCIISVVCHWNPNLSTEIFNTNK